MIAHLPPLEASALIATGIALGWLLCSGLQRLKEKCDAKRAADSLKERANKFIPVERTSAPLWDFSLVVTPQTSAGVVPDTTCIGLHELQNRPKE